LFDAIFQLSNTKCNQTCTDMRFGAENITESERQIIRDYFIDFPELFASLPGFEVKILMFIFRNLLSRMALFRLEVLPLFLDVIDDEIDMIPFLTRMVHYESEIRTRLSRNKKRFIDMQNIYFLHEYHLSEKV
ncbi:hypothetical protein PENTCL1PPCAC_19437, partial [Pristionchus entomophagus]